MNNFIKIIVSISLSVTVISACRTKDKVTITAPSGTGQVKMEFFNMAGSSTLNMGNQWYENEHGDSFKVSKFNYYISNIRLNGSTSTYTESNSYHLVEQSDLTTTSFDMANVPYDTYTSVTFMIGVDSLHDVTGTQSGALDPINDMFWSWTTGYIMMKFEGVSPRSTQTSGDILFHTGGFTGANNVLKTITVSFPQAITVTSNGENHIHLSADVLALFKSPHIIDFSALNLVNTPGPNALLIADNYANMFSVTYAGL